MSAETPVIAPEVTASAHRPRGLLIGGIVATAAFVLFGLGVMLGVTDVLVRPIDDAWRQLVGGHAADGLHLSWPAMFFQQLGHVPGGTLMVIVIPLVLIALGRWRSALFFWALCATTIGLYSQGMKNLVNRARPEADESLGLEGPLYWVDSGSYPSGHAIMVTALVIGVLALLPPAARRLRAAWLVISVLLLAGMAWQRTLINAHWFSDVVFGIVAGIGGGLLMWWAFWPWLQRDHRLPLRLLGRRPAASATADV